MIILIGESGSGKTTILNELNKIGYKKATNYTTREKRIGEESIGEYIFVTKSEFEKMWKENKLLQRAEFNNNSYGIGIDSLREDVVCISIVDSIKDIKQKQKELNLDDINIITIYIYVPAEERTKRMLKRGDSIKAIQERLIIDKEKFKNASLVADYVIENNNLQDTVNKIIELANNR